MKRKLTLFLSAVMAASSLPMTAYAAQFKDLSEVAWAADAINEAADAGLLSGYNDGTFKGKKSVTYPEAATMLYNVLTKSNAEPLDAVAAYQNMQVLETYGVQKWAQLPVAYCLENRLISMQDVIKYYSGGGKEAPREAVAMMFGNALAKEYDVDGLSKEAAKFADYWQISNEAMPMVDLMKRLGIISGDNYNRFNPKKAINRAEMAVILNKTFAVFADGVGSNGKIIDFTNNEGKYFFIEVEFENGEKWGFHATPENVKTFGVDGKPMSMGRLSEGDGVRVIHRGDMLSAIYVTDGTASQEKYDITGYITKMKNNSITVENENTGVTSVYGISDDCVCYLDGQSIKRKELEDILTEKYTQHAYAGLIVDVENDRVNHEWAYVTEVMELYVTLSENYTMMGKVAEMDESSVSFRSTGAGSEKTVTYTDDCKYYINGKASDLDALIDMSEEGTTYVKIDADKNGEAVKIDMSEDSFATEEDSNLTETKIFTVEDLSRYGIELKSGSKKTTYRFDEKNPIDNISFYIWDDGDEDWGSVKYKKAVEQVEDWIFADKPKTVYAKLDFNSGGKVSSVELSLKKGAWTLEDTQNEREGTVESLENGVLKFKGAKTTYTMRREYNDAIGTASDNDVIEGFVNGKDVRYPLNILSVNTSSLKVFTKMANDPDMELYAEIIADGNGVVQSVEAVLKKATGTMVEFDRDGSSTGERCIKIETDAGEVYTLATKRNPKLTDAEEDYFDLDSVEGTKYAGHPVILEFATTGEVDRLTFVNGPKTGDAAPKIEGIAIAAKDGLKLKGDSTLYKWTSAVSALEDEIVNHSGPHTSLQRIKKMIENKALEIYVEARLDEKDRIERFQMWVKNAEGVIDDNGYDEDGNGYIRIITENGDTCVFDLKSSVKIDIEENGKKFTKENMENGKADGMNVKLTFADDGGVSKIEKA